MTVSVRTGESCIYIYICIIYFSDTFTDTLCASEGNAEI